MLKYVEELRNIFKIKTDEYELLSLPEGVKKEIETEVLSLIWHSEKLKDLEKRDLYEEISNRYKKGKSRELLEIKEVEGYILVMGGEDDLRDLRYFETLDILNAKGDPLYKIRPEGIYKNVLHKRSNIERL